MIIISDTSPITALLTIDHIHVLKELFGSVYIPNAVYKELKKEHINLPEFIEIVQIKNKSYLNVLINDLDIGEAEAIVLAKERKADYLLIDEKTGREIAEKEGINIIGLMGVLLIAKQKGIIRSVRKILVLLENLAGFWISRDLKEIIINSAGE